MSFAAQPQQYNNQFSDGRMGNRNGQSRPQDARYNAAPGPHPVGYHGYQQPPYGAAPISMTQAQNMPLPIAPSMPGNVPIMPIFPPHPDTKQRPSYAPYPISSTQPRQNIQELVQVPTEMTEFASDPQFQQTLLKIKEQTGINYISLNRLTASNLVDSIQIDAPSRESAQLARGLIETHFKLNTRLKLAESRLTKVQNDLFSAQGEIASGMMIEFTIDPELIGLALGKKGARIKQIEIDTKVHSINVTGESGKILVTGPDSASVQRARELLELQEECVPLESRQIEWLSSKYNGHMLNDIRSTSDLIVTRVNKEKFTLDIVGTLAAVRNAKFMLPTQMEYVDKQIEIEGSEREAREKLSQVRKQYGMKSYGNGGAGGDKRGNGEHYDHRNSTSNNNNRDRSTKDSLVSSTTNTAPRRSTNTTAATSSANKTNNTTATSSNSKNKEHTTTSTGKKNTSDSKNTTTTPIPMLQQVVNKQKDTTNTGKSSQNASNKSSAKDNRRKSNVDEMVTSLEKLNMKDRTSTNTTTNTNTARNNTSSNTATTNNTNATANATNANNKDRRRNSDKNTKPTPTTTTTPAITTAAVSRVVEYASSPLPQRNNTRSNKKPTTPSATPTATTTSTTVATTTPIATTTTVEGENKPKSQQRGRGGRGRNNDNTTTTTAATTTAAPTSTSTNKAEVKPTVTQASKEEKNTTTVEK